MQAHAGHIRGKHCKIHKASQVKMAWASRMAEYWKEDKTNSDCQNGTNRGKEEDHWKDEFMRQMNICRQWE